MTAVVDAHQHFWVLENQAHPWRTSAHAVLERGFAPDDLAPELERAGVDGTVLMQSVNSSAETDYLLEIADRNPWVLGVVGWIPLGDPQEAARQLERYGSHPKFKGVRHLLSAEPDPDWLTREPVLASLELLAAQELVFDVVVGPRHLEQVQTVAERVPTLRLVLDHLATPPVLDGSWEPWASSLAAAARFPGMYAKVSVGIDVLTDWRQWSATALQPYVDWAVECFGPERLLFASNWPVVLLGADYQTAWQQTNAVLADLPAAARDAVLGGTAVSCYRLQPR